MSAQKACLGLEQGALRLLPHSAHWAALFAAERAAIAAAVLGFAAEIEHIGSTAVPGLPAKPILDIGLAAPAESHDRIAVALIALGYLDRGQRGGHLFIRHRGDVRTHNLHLYPPGDPEWHDHLAFRDALRADAALRDAYTRLKLDIIAQLKGQRLGYAEAKTEFIRPVLASAVLRN
jgi:GrpB-like predicted nucleotidyltransferase (UPF0157 family)